MGCGRDWQQTVPTHGGMSDKSVPAKCGQTGYYGDEVRCSDCQKKRPWYICRHGNDISEWDCFHCEYE
jgi:hypothetical protein